MTQPSAQEAQLPASVKPPISAKLAPPALEVELAISPLMPSPLAGSTAEVLSEDHLAEVWAAPGISPEKVAETCLMWLSGQSRMHQLSHGHLETYSVCHSP